MKIINLQSNWFVVCLGAFLGFITERVVETWTKFESIQTCAAVNCASTSSGWPFKSLLIIGNDHHELYNTIFWILVYTVILFSIQYFKNKN